MPERKVFPYMNIRRKAFPWGPQSFFFSDKKYVGQTKQAAFLDQAFLKSLLILQPFCFGINSIPASDDV